VSIQAVAIHSNPFTGHTRVADQPAPSSSKTIPCAAGPFDEWTITGHDGASFASAFAKAFFPPRVRRS
jgi:hypothetical protein